MTILVGGKWVLIASLAFFPLMAFAESVTVAWEDNSSDEAGFKVERGADGVNFTEIATVGANVTTYVDATAFSATKYYYRVAAYDATRQSEYSNVTSVTTAPANVAPVITVQPTASQTVNAGTKVTLSVSATGTPSPTYQWKKNGSAIAGATAATLTLNSVADGDAGNYSAVALNVAGSVSSSNALVVVQTIAVTPPPVSTPPAVTIVVPIVPSVEPTPAAPQPTDPIILPTPVAPSVIEQPSLVVPPVTPAPTVTPPAPVIVSDINQTPPPPAVVIENSVRTKTTAEAESSVQPVPSRLMNLSVRSIPGPDDRALLVGFVVKDASKSMLVRAVGPGLKTYTDVPTYGDPKLSINDGSHEIAVNDNWGGTDNLRNSFLRVGAFPLSDSSSDAAVLTELAPRSYTANVTGVGSGLALAEIYDADQSSTPSGRLVNLSARAYAAPGDGVLIVGFVISGDTPLRVLVRGIGPGLADKGVKSYLADPQLDLYRGNALLQHNDDWSGSTTLAAAFAQTGAFALSNSGSKDAALVATLSPGMYTVVVSGVGGTAGVALAEVYELP